MTTRYTVVDVEQRSEAWFAARVGRLTGSRAAAMLARGAHGLEAITRRAYRYQLAYERYSGWPAPEPASTVEMRRGIALEDAAIAAYAAETDSAVSRPGFLASTAHLAGCSLDGLLAGGAGILEVKVPNTATHCRYLQDGALPPEHRAQVRHNLWISGARYCDFVSFDDRVAPRWRVFLVRVDASELDLAGYEQHALAFLDEVARAHRGVVDRLGPPPARGVSKFVVHRPLLDE